MSNQQYQNIPPSFLQRPKTLWPSLSPQAIHSFRTQHPTTTYLHQGPAQFHNTPSNPATYPRPPHQLQYSVPNGWPYSQYDSNETPGPPGHDSWLSRNYQSGYQHPDVHRQYSLSKSARAPIEYPIVSSGLLYSYLPSPNPEFVFYQDAHFVNSPSQLSVYQRLQRGPKAAKQKAFLPRGTSSKSRHGVCRKPPQKGKAGKIQESLKGLSPDTSQGTLQCRDSTASLMSPLKTIRIEDPSYIDNGRYATDSLNCPITDIQSEEGIGTNVLAAIRLWNGQLDLAVEPASVDKVTARFKNLTRYRLEAFDPLFQPEGRRSQEETTLWALKRIHDMYQNWHRGLVTDRSNDRTRIQAWYAMEIKDLKERITDLEAK